jgi:hypothetical protein
LDLSIIAPLLTPAGLTTLGIALGYSSFGALEAKANSEDFSIKLFLKTLVIVGVAIYLTYTKNAPDVLTGAAIVGSNLGFMWAVDSTINKAARLLHSIHFTLPVTTGPKLLEDRSSLFPNMAEGTIVLADGRVITVKSPEKTEAKTP